jgi:hypothetical protein
MRIYKGGGGSKGRGGPLLGRGLLGILPGGPRGGGIQLSDSLIAKSSPEYQVRMQQISDASNVTKAKMLRDKDDPVAMARHQNTMDSYARRRSLLGSGSAVGVPMQKSSLLG